jgi:drug/metabolite transporter (DMT)-like permease
MAMSMIGALLGQFFLKKGITSSSLTFDIASIFKTIFSPVVFLGFVFYGLSSIMWLFVLQKFPVSVAYPSLAVTYVVTLLVGTIAFHEVISIQKIAGVLLIFVGVYVLNR